MIGRKEWKYVLPLDDSEKINFNLKSIVNKDSHTNEEAEYLIRSLYFDDNKNTAAKDVEAGVNERYKFRIRYYNCDASRITLEKKSKADDTCYKESCLINKEEYNDILNNNIEKYLYDERNLLKELAIKMIKNRLEPKVIIEYKRKAYVEEVSNTRITIDSNVCTSNEIECFLDGDYIRYPIQTNYENILEIKFGDILPKYIKRLCNISGLNRTSFSKYYLGYCALNGGKLNESFRNN